MSKFDGLISELCPDGVEYFSLGSLGTFFGGLTGKVKSDFVDGNCKFITYKNVYSNPALNLFPKESVKIFPNEKQRTLDYGDVIFTGSSETPDECGFSSVVCEQPTERLYLNSFCFFFRFNNPEVILPHFAKHLFRSAELRYQIGKTASGVTRFNVSKDKMAKIRIPLPPLAVQQKIVRILDSFTELTAELNEKLAAELTARRKQYEYYRDELLTSYISDSTVYLPLERCCKILDNKRKPVTKAAREAGKYPYYGANGIQDYVSNYIFDGTFVLVGEDGSVITAAGNPVVTWAEGQIWVNNHAHIIEEIDGFSLRYLYHYLQTVNVTKLIHGNIPKLTGTDFRAIPVPAVPNSAQTEIVQMLDRFDAICNDLTTGLPAEIAARQKQYENYRDKLLTFKKLETN